ncbi:MAG: Tim44-like domain-containing protein [Rhodocyclaceae bacterium]|nr:Tim44-like domain-containing protein [Rhodocyclaceae bacterium]
MKRMLIALSAVLLGLTFSLASFDAEARRLGGGKSFGMSRSGNTIQRQAAPSPSSPASSPAAAPKPGAAPQPSGASRWLGPIAGLAAGLGIAALLSHFGLGEGMANMLMILLLVMAAVFVFRLLFKKQQPAAALQPIGASAPMHFEPASAPTGSDAAWTASSVPAGFDAEGFLRQAKINFLRLQAANDAGNLEDIREFTTPEVFAEITMQLDERARAAQQTDVVRLDAELVNLVTEEGRHVASVRFHGQIREGADAAPETFDEVWHLAKPLDDSTGWKIAGIQQFH